MFCPVIKDSCKGSCVFRNSHVEKNCYIMQGIKDLGEIKREMKIKNETLENVDRAINFIARK